MNTIDINIQTYLLENKIATVCFIDESHKPYCINCFYAFDKTNGLLIFKSSNGTYHDSLVSNEGFTSGTILSNEHDLTKLKGIQFSGKIINSPAMHKLKLNTLYLKKYPMSLLIDGYYWGVVLNFIKFTDNTLGFGRKIIWKSET